MSVGSREVWTGREEGGERGGERGVDGKGQEGQRQKILLLPSVCLDIYMHKSAGITHTHTQSQIKFTISSPIQ